MKTFNEIPLQKTELLLKPYTGEKITPVGVLEVNVEYKGQPVFKNKGPVLMGMYWLYNNNFDPLQDTLRLACHQITEPAKEHLDTSMLDKYLNVFEDNLGTFYGMILCIEC